MNDGLNGSPILESQPNFRSFEGIRAINGRKFRANMVYRSGGLNKLSVTDISRLEEIGLAMVIDFRSDREVASSPNAIIPSIRKTLRIVIPDEARDRAMEFLDMNDAEGLEKVLITDYRRMIRNDTPRFAEFFRTLEQTNDLPLVFHCAAGKDRTGIASVLLLTSLGIDSDTVKQNYFLSNARLKAYADRLIRKVTEEGKNGEIIRPMMEVRPEYLQAALDEIDNSFGGMGNYLSQIIRVDAELLKAKYLE
ncbi:MAG: tyrosine-protein phosphatase [Bacteroidetes bacterium]|nr:tyrosine-protein phosphatase [Bacteroidota bacterium]